MTAARTRVADETQTVRDMTPVFVLAIGTFATGTDAFIVAGLLPSITHSLNASVIAGGQLVTAFALAYAIGSPLLTTATASWPRKLLLASSLLCFALVNVVAALSQTMAVLVVARVLAGLLAGLFVPTAAASAGALVAASRRGRALGVVLAGTALSTVFGVPIGLEAARLTNWRGAFLFVAVLAAVAAVAIAGLLPPVPPPPRLRLGERVAVLRRHDVVGVLLITISANAGAFSVYTYLAPVFSGVGGPGALQLLIFGFGVAAVVGGYLAGRSCDRWGPTPVLTTVLIVFTVNHFLLAMWTRSLATSLVYVAIWGLVGWGTVPPQQHRLTERAGPAASIALSLNASALYLGIACGSLLGSYIVHRGHADHLALTAGGGGALALLALGVSTVTERTHA